MWSDTEIIKTANSITMDYVTRYQNYENTELYDHEPVQSFHNYYVAEYDNIVDITFYLYL